MNGIWTACNGSKHIVALHETATRIVEAQEQVATRSLVDTLAEQALLEDLLDQSKPGVPASAARRHYLIQTPFRYPPLPRGSRFGDRRYSGIFYASLDTRTAFAECAYYRLVFLSGMASPLSSEALVTQHSSFQVEVRTKRGVYLDRPAFDKHAEAITSPVSYSATQRLGEQMRDAQVEAFVYRSARDSARGRNIGVFEARAIATREPRAMRAWSCLTAQDEVSFFGAHSTERYEFTRRDFLVNGKLPAPAI